MAAPARNRGARARPPHPRVAAVLRVAKRGLDPRLARRPAAGDTAARMVARGSLDLRAGYSEKERRHVGWPAQLDHVAGIDDRSPPPRSRADERGAPRC